MKKTAVILTALCLLYLSPTYVYADTTAPIAENLELCTYVNTTVNSNLRAYDPDSEELKYEITTQPVKGSIQLEPDGSFIYTPNRDKKGRDYFGYKAADPEGNYSQEATVIIKIEKQKKAVKYADMDGRAGEYYAAALSERGIFTGECICGEYCFYPDRELSKNEFVCMCVMAGGQPIIKNVMNTGLCDDAQIPEWSKQYVLASVMAGAETRESFNADEPVSREEAVKLLDSILNINDVSYISRVEYGEAAQACANLEAVGIIREGILKEEKLTRLDAAELLIKALELVERR